MERLRTFGIVAHIDAGKTTLTERILFDTGAQSFIGSVDEGTAAMDFMPAERTRGISITAAATRVAWGDCALQIVDTPGHVDFVAEVERCLRVIDGVVVLVDGVRGIESQTRAVWQQASAAQLPIVVFVNKLDRSGADFASAVVDIGEQFECRPVALVVPLLDTDGAFAGLGDALTGAVQWFEGRPAEELVPKLQRDLLAAHERLVEAAADCDEGVMADVVAGEPVAPDRIREAIRGGLLRGEVVPVLGGAALYNRGVDWLLDAVVSYLPVGGEQAAHGIWSLRDRGDESAPFCGFVFKVQHLDRVWNYVRIVRGRAVAGAAVVRGARPHEDAEELPELWSVRADRHEPVASAGPGEIVVVPGELGWRTGDSICDPEHPEVLSAPKFPAPVLAVTFEPDRAEDVQPLHAAVLQLASDDPTLRVARERDRILVRGMGELHLEIVADMARSRSGVGFRVSKPRVDRRETVLRGASGAAEVRAMVAGQEQVARCCLSVDLVPGGAAASISSSARGPLAEVAVEELRSRLAAGLRVGPLYGIEVRVERVEGLSEAEPLLEQAASKALENALSEAGLVELEPWVAFEVLAPAASSAAVLADLRARHADVSSVEAGRMGARMSGRVPLASVIGYVTRLRSISKGLGQVTLRPDGYGEAPGADAGGGA